MPGNENHVPAMTGRGEALRLEKNETTALQEQEDSPMPGKLTCLFCCDRDPALMTIDIEEENLDRPSAEHKKNPLPVHFREEPKYLSTGTPTRVNLKYWKLVEKDGHIDYIKEEGRGGRQYMDRKLIRMIKDEQIRGARRYTSPYTPTGVNPEWLKGQLPWIRALYGKEEPKYTSPFTTTGVNPEWLKMNETEGMDSSK
ncbi:MAG: hypothetical protein L6R37_002131 [Teloschistes peruensis]|nr:MAG: hypothetical protein L6R37_002131 [Teloschistes peruensis]